QALSTIPPAVRSQRPGESLAIAKPVTPSISRTYKADLNWRMLYIGDQFPPRGDFTALDKFPSGPQLKKSIVGWNLKYDAASGELALTTRSPPRTRWERPSSTLCGVSNTIVTSFCVIPML